MSDHVGQSSHLGTDSRISQSGLERKRNKVTTRSQLKREFGIKGDWPGHSHLQFTINHQNVNN